ncbi:MAG: hypothetical protein LBD49_04175 [Oscillospiraceae bacterium]|jgi:DNA-directed RNA polymerase subunit RPC12/RpoP|nr:hypothetical protein [Oscillospiraceae bacterium]
MSAIETVSYLKGLAEGLEIDAETKEGKLFTAIINALNGIAEEIDELGESISEFEEELDDLAEGLENIEEVVFGDDDDDEDCDCCGDEDGVIYEVSCPSCGEDLSVDEDSIESGSVVCPKCGEKLEFEFDDEPETE